MVDVALSAARLLFAVFLVALNGFFVAAEFAFVRLRMSAVDRLVAQGKPGAGHLQVAVDHLDDYLAVSQLGITIASLGLGWAGEPAVAALIEPALESLLPAEAIRLTAFAIGFGIITFLHVVFGELVPKTLGIQEAERIGLAVALPMRGFYYLFVPGIVVFNGLANRVTGALGVPPASETEETLTEEELLAILARSGRRGKIDADEVAMIERVFTLDDLVAREVMVPRPDVATVPADLPLAALRAVFVEEPHTRVPVVADEEPERVVGFLDAKDVLGAIDDADAAVTAGDLARPVTVVPESGRLDDLLRAFQSDRSQLAVVIDEWGAFEGIVTVEDVVEVIVGDLHDAFDPVGGTPTIDARPDGSYVLDGAVTLAAVNEALGTDLESDAYETIAGIVLDRLGRAPEPGDRVELDGYEATVSDVDGTRIAEVRLAPLEETDTED